MPTDLFIAKGGAWKTGAGRRSGAGTLPPPELPPLFPGHIPFRVLVGANAPDDNANPNTPPRPQYLEQEDLLDVLGAPPLGGSSMGFARRMFSPNWYTRTKLNSMVTECESRNQLPVVSFKVANDWDGVANGDYDAQLLDLVDYAHDKRVVNGGNGKPFLFSIHHEPNGDGPAGMTLLQQLAAWGAMHEHLVDYVSGALPGNTEDVTDICVVAPIGNGFWWGTKNSYPDRIAAAFPPSLLAKLNAKGGPVMSDVYDPAPNTWSRNGSGDRDEATFTFNTNYDRCWRNAQGMVTWARANNVKSIGFGEFGNVLTANWDQTIDVFMNNRDIISVACMFNNFANSAWDWRTIPDGYGAFNGTNSKGLVDEGGDALSAAYMAKFKILRDRSQTETTPF